MTTLSHPSDDSRSRAADSLLSELVLSGNTLEDRGEINNNDDDEFERPGSQVSVGSVAPTLLSALLPRHCYDLTPVTRNTSYGTHHAQSGSVSQNHAVVSPPGRDGRNSAALPKSVNRSLAMPADLSLPSSLHLDAPSTLSSATAVAWKGLRPMPLGDSKLTLSPHSKPPVASKVEVSHSPTVVGGFDSVVPETDGNWTDEEVDHRVFVEGLKPYQPNRLVLEEEDDDSVLMGIHEARNQFFSSRPVQGSSGNTIFISRRRDDESDKNHRMTATVPTFSTTDSDGHSLHLANRISTDRSTSTATYTEDNDSLLSSVGAHPRYSRSSAHNNEEDDDDVSWASRASLSRPAIVMIPPDVPARSYSSSSLENNSINPPAQKPQVVVVQGGEREISRRGRQVSLQGGDQTLTPIRTNSMANEDENAEEVEAVLAEIETLPSVPDGDKNPSLNGAELELRVRPSSKLRVTSSELSAGDGLPVNIAAIFSQEDFHLKAFNNGESMEKVAVEGDDNSSAAAVDGRLQRHWREQEAVAWLEKLQSQDASVAEAASSKFLTKRPRPEASINVSQQGGRQQQGLSRRCFQLTLNSHDGQGSEILPVRRNTISSAWEG